MDFDRLFTLWLPEKGRDSAVRSVFASLSKLSVLPLFASLPLDLVKSRQVSGLRRLLLVELVVELDHLVCLSLGLGK